MGIDHRGADILVTEQFLDGPDVVAVLKQMGPERMTERVAAGRFGDPEFSNSFFDCPLPDGFVEMMSFLLTGLLLAILFLLCLTFVSGGTYNPATDLVATR